MSLLNDKRRTLLEEKKNSGDDGRKMEQSKAKKERRPSMSTYNQKNSKLFEKVGLIISTYFKNEAFEDRIEIEFEDIVEKLESSNPQCAGEITISFNHFTQSLLKYMDPANESCSNEMTVIGLKILRKHIEKVNDGENDPDEPKKAAQSVIDWDADLDPRVKQQLKKKQKNLVGLKTVDLICEILKQNDDLKVLQETLLLAIALLLQGNHESQTAFYEFFINDKQSEMLTKLKDLLLQTFEVVKKGNRERNSNTMKDFYRKEKEKNEQGGGDNEDQDHIHGTIDASGIKNEVEDLERNYTICRYIFKFLQLLCEGHNKDLQDYLRHQNNSNNNVVSKGINFINTSATIWGSYIKFVNLDCDELGSDI
jgi:hypothetical protein